MMVVSKLKEDGNVALMRRDPRPRGTEKKRKRTRTRNSVAGHSD